jgi:guanylate kinase
MPNLERLSFSVSHTTRAPRPGEREGESYYFVNQDTFEKMCDQGAFLEWAKVHDQFYGTSRKAVFTQLVNGIDVILDIDVQGAAIIRRSGLVEASFIFIAPPHLADLERRLRGRNQDSEQTIRLRMKNAEKEMQAIGEYDYLIVNEDIDEAAKVLEAIILAERARMHRLPSGLPIEKTAG